ncbi:MAG: WD40 repeat domain-containing protein [Polyangiales bacterium]
MSTRPPLRLAGLRALGAGLMLWSGVHAAGCGSPTPTLTPVETVPAPPRNLLNQDDLALASPRADGTVSPARPVIRTAIRRYITSAVFSPDSKRVFAVSSHGELVAYDVETGALRAYARPWFDEDSPALDVDASGSRVLVSTFRHGAILWDLRSDTLRTLAPAPSREDESRLVGYALHPRGDSIAGVRVGADQLTLETARPDDGGRQETTLITSGPQDEDGEGWRVQVLYSPSGARIAVVTPDGRDFTLHDTSDLSVVHSVRLEGDAPEDPDQRLRVAFRPQGGQLLLARPGRIELADSRSGRVRADFDMPGEATPDVTYSADGRFIVAVAETQGLYVEAETGRVLARVELPAGDVDPEYATFRVVPLPGEGGFVAIDGNGERTFFDARGVIGELPAMAGPSGEPPPVFSPDGGWSLAGVNPPELRRGRDATLGSSFVQEGAQVSVWGASFSMDGRVLFTRSRAGVSRFAAEGMRDLACGSEQQVTRGPTGAIAQLGGYSSCLFDSDRIVESNVVSTHDGSVTATYRDDEFVVQRSGGAADVRLRRSRSSKVRCEDPRTCMRMAHLSPDGAAIAFLDSTRDGGTRRVWWEVYETRTGRLRAQGSTEGYATLQMLAGGAFAVVANETFRFYDARGRQRLEVPQLASRAVSADGALVAVGTTDREVRVLDVTSGRERERWTASSQLHLYQITPDHQRILAMGDGHMVVATLDGSSQRASFSVEEPTATNFAGTFGLACEGGRVVRFDLRSGAQADVAPCEGRTDAISEDGAFAVTTVGSSTRVHRLSDGRVLTLETLAGASSLRVAYDDTGRWDVSEADPTRVLIRAAGPGDTAPLESPADAAGTPGLFGLFVTGQ